MGWPLVFALRCRRGRNFTYTDNNARVMVLTLHLGSPTSSVVRVGEQRTLRALPYDRSRRRVETNLTFTWEVIEGGGALEHGHDQVAIRPSLTYWQV